jgi:hypothetical protein
MDSNQNLAEERYPINVIGSFPCTISSWLKALSPPYAWPKNEKRKSIKNARLKECLYN